MKVICFHNPEEENGYLSNWYYSDFVVEDIKFTSMEQYMMYEKSILFHDFGTAKKILDTDDVSTIKALGRAVHNYNENQWNGLRQIIVYDGLCEKFKQNLSLMKLLKDTGTSLLAECAVNDKIWGIGISMNDPKRFDLNMWKGSNLLGYSLMQVRNKLTK